MDALEVLQGTTHSLSAGAPSSLLRRFHLPHWESLLTHCGFYKGLINTPLRPKPGRRLKCLRGRSRGLGFAGKGYRRRDRMETRPSTENTRACVWSPNPEELQGKRRDRPKSLGKQRGQIRLSGLTPDKFTNRKVDAVHRNGLTGKCLMSSALIVKGFSGWSLVRVERTPVAGQPSRAAASAWLDSMAATISISADHRSYTPPYYMASLKIGSLDTWVHLK
nr:uncharacterized protein LOC108007718 isoform X2 [Drosophila suzukii]